MSIAVMVTPGENNVWRYSSTNLAVSTIPLNNIEALYLDTDKPDRCVGAAHR